MSRYLWICAGLLLMLLVGCSGDTPPKGDPPPTPSVVTTKLPDGSTGTISSVPPQ